MPTRVKVGGAVYQIAPLDHSVAVQLGHWGQTKNYARLIEIDDALKGEQFASSLLHEVLHAIFFEWCLRDDDSEERCVNGFECGLHAVIVDNPELFDWIVEEMRHGAE